MHRTLRWLTVVDRRDPLEAVERVAFAEEVSSSMRHAVRNKIAAARNFMYIQRKLSKTDPSKSEPRIRTLHALIDTQLDAAGQLLDPEDALAHLFTRRAERVRVSRCVRDAVDHARVGPRSSAVRVDVGEDAEMFVDPRELALAIRCLVENAVEATGGKGHVSVGGSREDGRVIIQVVDDGPGIVEAQRIEALRPFFTTKPGHAGLGLSIATRIARRYHGELALGTSAKGGVAGTIALPMAEDPA
jgi:C4-dicarboxylate-specific signal transduction histidine kinase